jgi:CRP-like cAMP-binding protein
MILRPEPSPRAPSHRLAKALSRTADARPTNVRIMVMICGHVFFTEGQLGHQLFIIVSGKVKLGHRTWDGRQSLFAIREPSDTSGELSAFDPGPPTSTRQGDAARSRACLIVAVVRSRDDLFGALAEISKVSTDLECRWRSHALRRSRVHWMPRLRPGRSRLRVGHSVWW